MVLKGLLAAIFSKFNDKSMTNYYKKDNHKYANLTFALNGGHFTKWPPEYTCFNMSVSNSRRKILVSKHTFSGPRITKKTIINTQSRFFQNGRQNIHALLSQFLIDLEKRSWVSKYTFLGQRITQKSITNTHILYFYLNGSHFFKMASRIYMF